MPKPHIHPFSWAGMLVTLGIVFGDIGTSPLYVFKAIVGEDEPINERVVLGGLSCIFWTLTLQTTFKYILITLQADNRGEGGVFSLYALVRRFGKWAWLPAMIGAAMGQMNEMVGNQMSLPPTDPDPAGMQTQLAKPVRQTRMKQRLVVRRGLL